MKTSVSCNHKSNQSRLNVSENPLQYGEFNGMRLFCKLTDSFVTTIGCCLPAGSMHERSEERGASLLMEHLIFRVNVKLYNSSCLLLLKNIEDKIWKIQRTTCRSPEEITILLNKTGGKLGALAMRDMFFLYGTVPSGHVDSIVALLADVILNGQICESIKCL